MCDHRLVGEGFKQLDLRRCEGAQFDATRGHSTNEFPLLTKRNGQEAAPAANIYDVGNRSTRSR